MLALVLSAAIVLVVDAPEIAPCDRPPAYEVRVADGRVIQAIRAEYLPDSLGLVIVPAVVGERIYCDGFEP